MNQLEIESKKPDSRIFVPNAHENANEKAKSSAERLYRRRNDPKLPTNPSISDAYDWLVKSVPDVAQMKKIYWRFRKLSEKFNSNLDTAQQDVMIKTNRREDMLIQLKKLFKPVTVNSTDFIPTSEIWESFKDFSPYLEAVTDQNYIGIQQALDLRSLAYNEARLPDHFAFSVNLEDHLNKINAAKTKKKRQRKPNLSIPVIQAPTLAPTGDVATQLNYTPQITDGDGEGN